MPDNTYSCSLLACSIEVYKMNSSPFLSISRLSSDLYAPSYFSHYQSRSFSFYLFTFTIYICYSVICLGFQTSPILLKWSDRLNSRILLCTEWMHILPCHTFCLVRYYLTEICSWLGYIFYNCTGSFNKDNTFCSSFIGSW